MTIGHLVPMNNGKEGDELKRWLQLIVQPVGMSRISCTFYENKNKQNDKAPDYILYESIQRKGDLEKFGGKPFRTRSIGGGYKKTSSSGFDYISCSLETPLVYGGKINFSLFPAKPYENESPEDVFWLYDAVWQPYKKQNNNNYNNGGGYAEPSTYTSNPNGGDIPVTIENAQGQQISADELSNYM